MIPREFGEIGFVSLFFVSCEPEGWAALPARDAWNRKLKHCSRRERRPGGRRCRRGRPRHGPARRLARFGKVFKKLLIHGRQRTSPVRPVKKKATGAGDAHERAGQHPVSLIQAFSPPVYDSAAGTRTVQRRKSLKSRGENFRKTCDWNGTSTKSSAARRSRARLLRLCGWLERTEVPAHEELDRAEKRILLWDSSTGHFPLGNNDLSYPAHDFINRGKLAPSERLPVSAAGKHGDLSEMGPPIQPRKNFLNCILDQPGSFH